MKKVILLLSVVALIFAAGCSEDDAAYNVNLSNDISIKVDGYVFHGVGDIDSALAGVTVTISGKTATTDAKGYYSIAGLSAGDYTLKFEKEGFVTIFQQGVSVEADNFYGDAKQTFSDVAMFPKNNTVTIKFFRPDFDGNGMHDDTASVTDNILVQIEYQDVYIEDDEGNVSVYQVIDDIKDVTISNGTLVLENVADIPLDITIDDLEGDKKYDAEFTIYEYYIERGLPINVIINYSEDFEYDEYDIDLYINNIK